MHRLGNKGQEQTDKDPGTGTCSHMPFDFDQCPSVTCRTGQRWESCPRRSGWRVCSWCLTTSVNAPLAALWKLEKPRSSGTTNMQVSVDSLGRQEHAYDPLCTDHFATLLHVLTSSATAHQIASLHVNVICVFMYAFGS